MGAVNPTGVRMFCADVRAVPAWPAPAPYSVRRYRAGDAQVWTDIQARADRLNAIGPELFRSQFGTDDAELVRRQCFVCDAAGVAVATVAAWFAEDRTRLATLGRVHWVAVVPEHQGRGLGRVLMSVVCARLSDLGCAAAYLTTSAQRVPALNLYFSVGFLPQIESDAERECWRALIPCGAVQGVSAPLLEWLRRSVGSCRGG